jgi:SpoVK/Ycf46/Vps4 family AAA+-type ATPase
MNTGKSLSCLFVGESGTGKTMTAEAIAAELGQALYPVNLAGVVSKWVGETEKNIAAVFASARESQAILFIDEADTLFGSRLDDNSHHADYINGQVNLLLTETDANGNLRARLSVLHPFFFGRCLTAGTSTV